LLLSNPTLQLGEMRQCIANLTVDGTAIPMRQ